MIRLIAVFLGFAGVVFAAPFGITHLAVQQYEDGPAVYKPDTFTEGETVYFSFYAEGFTRKENQVRLSFEARPTDPSGVAIAPAVPGKNEATLAPEDKDWVPKLRGSFVLPAILLRGEYHLAIHLTDAIADRSADKDISFLVTGPALEPAGSLRIANLDFYRNDDAEKPLDVAAYRSGEEVHARFLIAGYGHSDAGAIDVSYGVRLTDTAGHVLFEEPSAAHDSSTEFYPKPYVPGSLTLTLKPETTPGEYTLTVTARDAVGKRKAEAHRSFRLE